jgi:hypothetical protein
VSVSSARLGRSIARLSAIALVAGSTLASAFAADSAVTFHRDVEPVLQKNCQSCHRPGDIGPMPLLSYEQARPWAKSIRAAVSRGEMPPWHADRRYGTFSNDRSLTQSEIDTLVRWAETGATQGSPADAPPPVTFTDGWRIGTPDVVYEMPKEFNVPASGTVMYQWIMVPSGFTEDKWVQAVEVRPGNRAVVHHAVVYAREEGADWANGAPVGEFFNLFSLGIPKPVEGNTMFGQKREPEHLEVFAPGADPIVLAPGQARLIKAGSYIVFEMHYTPTGEAASDRSSVGLVFAKGAPTQRVRTLRVQNGERFSIPPGEDDYRIVSRVRTLRDLSIVAFMPHMHLRGKSMEFEATYPDGRSEILLSVPDYDFHWQTTYYLEEPKRLPAGTFLICRASWDNSDRNPDNPNPAATVREGLQSEEEMMAGFVELGIEASTDSDVWDFFEDAPLEVTGEATQQSDAQRARQSSGSK